MSRVMSEHESERVPRRKRKRHFFVGDGWGWNNVRTTVRRCGVVGSIAAGWMSVSSAIPLSDFVASGEYARARTLAADCRSTFIPALDPTDRLSEIPSSARVPFVEAASFRRAGDELAYRYRLARVNAGVYRHELDTAYAYARGGERGRTRLESYELEGQAMTIASTPTTQGGCTRILIVVTPATLQVGIRGGTVVSTASLAGLYDALGRGGSRQVTTPTINPDTIHGVVRVEVYENGAPAIGRSVTLWTDARAQPGRYGTTVGHEHVLASAPPPTIRLDGQASPGAHVVAQTDGQGEIQFGITPGWRGGPEAILAQATLGGTTTTAARAVVVRHRVFVDFAQTFGFDATHPPRPSTTFPFLFTGYTSRHHYAHFIQRDVAGAIRSTLLAIWGEDPGRVSSPTPHYFVLNDMSTEYGGLFLLNADDDCDDPGSTSAHQTHNVGLDFDLSPCYTFGDDGTHRLSANACETAGSTVLKIDERVLTARVIGDIGGAIYRHSPETDGAPYHYHIRFPQAN